MTESPSLRCGKPTGETLYTIRFTTFEDQPTSRLNRKYDRKRERAKKTRSCFHYIEDIQPLPCPVKMRCIQVDSPSHQYLAGTSMVPTHNSELGAALALNMLVNDDEWKAEVYSCASDRHPVIYGLKDDEDWHKEENWYKANPSLGYTIDIEKVRDAYHKALETPADEAMFRQLRLNQWVTSSVLWMPMDKWDMNGGDVDPDELKGRECYGGLDLSSTSDLTTLVLVFPPRNEDEKYIVLPFFWLPEETLQLRVRRDHVLYDKWKAEGKLMTTEGNVVHYGFIEQFICGLPYDIHEIAYDRWNAIMMVQNLEMDGFNMVPFGQGFRDMSPPSKELMRLVLEGRLNHGNHPVLRWNVNNAYVRTDPAGNIKIDKQRSTEKVDGAVALVMALDRATKQGGGSVYDDRGIITL